MKKLFNILILGMILFSIKSCDFKISAETNDIFYEDFSNGTLDSDKWLVAYKNWGGNIVENGISVNYNGGVIPQNVSVLDGKLILKGLGNYYDGDILGINRDMSFRQDGKRVGSAIATKDYYASGSYEIYAKVAPELGACSAMWTFEYEEDWNNDTIINHEIDIEMPGRPTSDTENQSFSYALCNTWTGENDGEYKTNYTNIGSNQADGNFHKYRFDWHTGDVDETPRVEFYFDDVLTYTSYEHIPTNAGRFWLGIWFPKYWAGTPNFDTSNFVVDYVKITPFHESGDTPQNETYPNDGWGDLKDINTSENSVIGDINEDGIFNIADVMLLHKYILNVPNITIANWQNGDLSNDNKLNIFDLYQMKKLLLNKSIKDNDNIIHVTNSAELQNALANAKAGDEIVLASNTYIYDGVVNQWRTFIGQADGTEKNPIILRSEDPENPAIIDGTTTSSYYGLTITGDWWIVKDITVTNASKGIIIDNSNHTQLINCEVFNTGTEGIHIRDGSSYCTIDSCKIHDTGVVSAGYGEGIYIGSAKSTSEYDHICDYNTIKNCEIGSNVSAECIDIKEYTTGTVVENCIFDGKGCTGENYSKAFVNIKGNDCIIRNCIGYRNGCDKITRAFEQNNVVDGWGQNAYIYGNKVYMDTSTNSSGKMYFLSSWDCSCTVWDNYMAYDDTLFTVDNQDDHWNYYNCNLITYGDSSYEKNIKN